MRAFLVIEPVCSHSTNRFNLESHEFGRKLLETTIRVKRMRDVRNARNKYKMIMVLLKRARTHK